MNLIDVGCRVFYKIFCCVVTDNFSQNIITVIPSSLFDDFFFYKFDFCYPHPVQFSFQRYNVVLVAIPDNFRSSNMQLTDHVIVVIVAKIKRIPGTILGVQRITAIQLIPE